MKQNKSWETLVFIVLIVSILSIVSVILVKIVSFDNKLSQEIKMSWNNIILENNKHNLSKKLWVSKHDAFYISWNIINNSSWIIIE